MDESLWIALAIIFTIVLAITLLIASSRKQAQKRKSLFSDALDQAAKAEQLGVDQSVFFRNRAAGIDLKAAVLFYVVQDQDEMLARSVDLSLVTHSEVMMMGNTIRTPEGNGKFKSEEHINAIQLQLKCNSQELERLDFYIEAEDGAAVMLENKQLAENWKALIGAVKLNRTNARELQV